MDSSKFRPFIVGVSLTFCAFALQNAIAQDTGVKLPKGITVGEAGAVYDDGQYVYVVQPKTGETLMISKNSTHRVGEKGESIPVAYRFQGNFCEPIRSKSWK